MSRTIFGTFVAIAALASLAMPASAHAQLSGLLKRKAKEAAINKAIPQPGAPADSTTAAATPAAAEEKARRDAWEHPVAITSAGLDGFVKAIKVENAERAKFMAASPASSPLGQSNAYQTAKAKCASDKVKEDSTQARYQRTLMAEASAGHPEKIKPYTDSIQALGLASQARNQRCSSLVQPRFADDDFKAIHAEEDKEEAAGAAAGGFTPLVYSRLKERVIAYALMPAGWKPSGYSPDELRVIDARRAELKPLVGSDFDNSGQRKPLGS
jgi:hypothetical protein